MSFIDRPQSVWWRKALFQVHLWTGVTLGLYLILICLTGSLLVFQRELEDDVPRLGNDMHAGPVCYGQLAATALGSYAGSTLDSIDMRTHNRRVVSVGLRQNGVQRIAWLDSMTGRIVGDEVLEQRHPMLTLAEDLHNQLAAGVRGGQWNGAGGALFFVMSLTGIVVWWPGRRNWKRALRVKWNARWARLNWDLHSAFGFWCLLFVAMWGLSGAYFIFPAPFQRAIAVFSSMQHLREIPSDWRPGEGVLPVDTFIARARQLFPQDQLAYVYVDTYRAAGVVKVFMSRNPLLPLSVSEAVISFQPATGRILSDISSARWTAGERLSLSIYSVHFGDFGGWPVKVVWAVLGLVPVLLTVTGYVMWWNRVLRKKWVRLRAVRQNVPALRAGAETPPRV